MDAPEKFGHVGPYEQWEQHESTLPALAGKTANIVGETRNAKGQLVISVQCAACRAVYTSIMILSLNEVNHAIGDNVWGPSGTRPYKRCRSCRINGRHPEPPTTPTEVGDQFVMF